MATLTTHLCCIYLHLLLLVESAIKTRPKDSFVLVGEEVRLECSTNLDEQMIWRFTPVGSKRNAYDIFNGKRFIQRLASRCSVDTSGNNQYTLVILNVTQDDAGRYDCVDDDGFGEKSSAEFGVIDNKAVMNNSTKNSCSLKVYGNFKSEVSCSETNNGGQPSPNTNTVNYKCSICISKSKQRKRSLDTKCFQSNIDVEKTSFTVVRYGELTWKTNEQPFTTTGIAHVNNVRTSTTRSKKFTHKPDLHLVAIIVLVIVAVIVCSVTIIVVLYVWKRIRHKSKLIEMVKENTENDVLERNQQQCERKPLDYNFFKSNIYEVNVLRSNIDVCLPLNNTKLLLC